MKTIASLLIFAVCAVADVAPPTIRDAFVAGSGDKIVRNARLTDNLLIAVCRSDRPGYPAVPGRPHDQERCFRPAGDGTSRLEGR